MFTGKYLSKWGILVTPLVLVSARAGAEVLEVPSQYATIQEALVSAQPGDEVVILPGVYTGDGNIWLQVPDMNLTIRSQSEASSTVLDGEADSQEVLGFVVDLSAGHTVAIRGLTLRRFSGDGGAVHARGSGDLVVEYCILLENQLGLELNGEGGALGLFENIRATITGCVFQGNETHSGGAVAVRDEARADFRGCKFRDNHASLGGAVDVESQEEVSFEDCDFNDNHAVDGGAISQWAWGNAPLNLIRCAIVNNGAGNHGGGLQLSDTATVDRCTIAQNYAGLTGGGMSVSGIGTTVSVRRSIVRGNCGPQEQSEKDISNPGSVIIVAECSCFDLSGISNFENFEQQGEQVWSDPLFCAPTACGTWGGDDGDYGLSDQSPCAAWNSPCGETIGARGVSCSGGALGACCQGDECLITPPGVCAEMGGAYQGDGTQCDPNPCTPTATERTTWGALKARYR